MPKNTKGGNKAKKCKNSRYNHPLVIKDVDTEYAVVLSNLGGGSCSLKIIGGENNNLEVRGIIRGIVKRQRFLKGDILLVGKREFQSSLGLKIYDIRHKYNSDHIEELKFKGEIPKNQETNKNIDEHEINIEFGYTNEEQNNNSDGEDNENNESENEQILNNNVQKRINLLGANCEKKSKISKQMHKDSKISETKIINIDDI